MTVDAQYVAYVKQDARGLNIYVQPTAGGEARPVTRSSSLKHHPRWSPNGDRLAFVEVDSVSWLVTIGRDGSGYARVGRLSESSETTFAPFGWAPDSRGLVWEYDGRIWRAGLSDQPEARLPVPPVPITRIWGVSVSPSGDSVAALSHYYPGGAESTVQIHVASLTQPDAGWSTVLQVPKSTLRTPGADAAALPFFDWVQLSLQPWRLGTTIDLVYSGQQDSRDMASVFRIPVAGDGVPRLQADLSAYCAGGIVEISATADLSRMVCSEIDATRDIWLVELLGGDAGGQARF